MAATAIFLDDIEPGMLDAKDYISHVEQQLHQQLTTDILFKDLDLEHKQAVSATHFICALVEFIPQLAHLSVDVSRLLCGPLAKHHMQDNHKTQIQSLGTNAEHKVETQGML